jgi:hypothetical protein
MDAACDALDQRGYISDQVAATLRAVAKLVDPGRNPLDDSDVAAGVHSAHHAISQHLLIIADELEQE